MKKIIVASTNKVKIQTALNGFQKVFHGKLFAIEGIAVQSNVSDQPMSDDETFIGAMNRMNAVNTQNTSADYWVGMESGLEVRGKDMYSFGWVVISDKERKIGKGRTSTFILPQKISNLILQGVELGKADDIVFNRNNSGQTNGAIGILTRDVITRVTLYEQAVIFALIPFINPTLY